MVFPQRQLVVVWPPWPGEDWFEDDKTNQALPPNQNCFLEATAFLQVSEWIHEYESHVGEKFRGMSAKLLKQCTPAKPHYYAG